MNDALIAALRSFFRPKMLRLVWLPLLAALLLWVLLGLFFWHDLVDAMRGLIVRVAEAGWISSAIAHVLSEWIVTAAMLFALLPLTYASALLVTALVAMPVMVNDVEQREYPQLLRRHGGTFAGSLGNAVGSTLVYLMLWIVTLPLWLLGLPALVLPLLINGWYNQRLFRYDALAEHADKTELRTLKRRFRAEWFGLGLAAAALELMPLLNLVSPVYSGLSFIHFGLARLEKLRIDHATSSSVADPQQST